MDYSGNNINIQNENYLNNNGMQMNQVNQNQFPLYFKMLQQTFQNMQPNMNPIDINFNNMGNLLSLINLPIIIPNHINHPLINCKTPGRDIGNNCWQCNNCLVVYSYSVPSFYCTSCDFDFCQKCLLNLKASDIAIYNYQLNNSLTYYTDDYSKSKHYKPNIHKHPIMRIIREPCFFENEIHCNLCYDNINQTDQFYYCSLCNYCICMKCYESKDEKFVDNPEYLAKNKNEQNI